jgi:hypothetical protein
LNGILRRLHMADTDLPAMAVARDSTTASGQLLPYVFSLPLSIAALGTVYGEERGERAGPSERVELIRDQVQVLAALEVQVQSAFLAMKTRFSERAPKLSSSALH